MKVIVVEDGRIVDEKKAKKSWLVEWLIHIIGYAIVLILVSLMFDSFHLDNSCYGLYALLASIIISTLNQTIKPALVFLTLPITLVSLGFFYPFVNVIILKLTDFILMGHFDLNGFLMAFIVALFISFFNILMEGLVIKPIIRRTK